MIMADKNCFIDTSKYKTSTALNKHEKNQGGPFAIN